MSMLAPMGRARVSLPPWNPLPTTLGVLWRGGAVEKGSGDGEKVQEGGEAQGERKFCLQLNYVASAKTRISEFMRRSTLEAFGLRRLKWKWRDSV